MKNPKMVIFYNQADAGRLHCDDCGYDMPEGCAFTRDLIGTKCPKCAANMLTREDYEKTKRLFRGIDLVNKILGPLFGERQPPAPQDSQSVSLRIHGDTTTITHK